MGPERGLKVLAFISWYSIGKLCVGANPTLITIFWGVLSQFTIYRGF